LKLDLHKYSFGNLEMAQLWRPIATSRPQGHIKVPCYVAKVAT